MDINIAEQNRFLIVRIQGELDHHSADDIRTKTDKAFARSQARHIIFDFRHVSFMDSSGIGMIIGRYKMLSAAGGKVFAVGIGDNLKRIFDISGLPKIIGCYRDAEEAMATEKGGEGHA